MKYVYMMFILLSMYYIIVVNYTPYKKNYTTPYTTKSFSLEQLKPYLQKRIDYIKNNSGLLYPYNDDKMNLFAPIYSSGSSLSSIALSNILLPNTDMGNLSVVPLESGDPTNYTTFQFGQGGLGWYFIFGTFLNPTPSNYFIYIARIETIPEEMRRQENIPLGSGTLYNICGGVGMGGNWIKSPYMVCRGSYSVFTETNFSFVATDLPSNWSCALNSTGMGVFDLNFQWDLNGQSVGIMSANLFSQRPAFYEGIDGCLPCIGGAGSLYLSYTNLSTECVINNGSGNTVKLTGGIGWMDREWVNVNVDSKYIQILSNITATWSGITKGLGKYLWIPIYLENDLQYVISGFPPEGVLKNGDKIDKATVNKFNGNGPSYDIQGCTLTVDTVKMVGGVFFPVIYRVNLEGTEYILDSTPFGDTYTIDVTGNMHWTGSAVVYDASRTKVMGVGFLEANQLQEPDIYCKTILDQLGISSTQENIDIMNDNKLPLSKTWYSFFIVLVVVSLIVCLLYYILSYLAGRIKKVK